MPLPTSPFALPARLEFKADPALIETDVRHFAAISECLAETIDELTRQRDAALKAAAGHVQQALERDLEVHRLGGRLRALRRFGLDLCLGRVVHDESDEPIYIGRFGLTDADGRQLLVDWRSPAAEPFFGATHATPMGLVSRRRYRWTLGRITDYWDEVFALDGIENRAALDDQSAFIASLGGSRSARMRDVLGTIQADQDGIIRAGSRGALVVDGGPGTGKTVVALHRTAYLLYSDTRLAHGGGVLFVGPHQPYLNYVADVLPSLGEESVQTCTLRDLVPEGPGAVAEPDVEIARLKSSAQLVTAVRRAIALSERPPAEGMKVETDWADVWLSAEDWAEAFDSAEPGTPHNEARAQVWATLVDILADRFGGRVSLELLEPALRQNEELRTAFTAAWPMIDAARLIAALWSTPRFLARCAPWLSDDELRMLERPAESPWTIADLPFLDAARQALGSADLERLDRERESERAEQRAQMALVVDNLIAADDGEGLVTMLRGDDVKNSLDDDAALPVSDADLLAGPFAHIVIDEAQELTDAEWQMLLARCPSRSFTIVGDRAQARHGFTESWVERLMRIGLRDIRISGLSINYRTPEEIMTEAAPYILAALPDANVPTSIRATGRPVLHAPVAERDGILDAWLAEHDEGIACVIGDPTFEATARVSSLSAPLVKGLEFDLVILVEPTLLGTGIEGAVDRYVSMTRATQQLAILGS